jgi:hypothetical protein
MHAFAWRATADIAASLARAAASFLDTPSSAKVFGSEIGNTMLLISPDGGCPAFATSSGRFSRSSANRRSARNQTREKVRPAAHANSREEGS